MWITGKLTSEEGAKTEIGVFEYDGDQFYITAGKRIPINGFAAPYGYFAVPVMGSAGMALPCEDGFLFGGSIDKIAGAEPGEILIRSSGGAFIKLMANGEISLNGLIIGSDGQIK